MQYKENIDDCYKTFNDSLARVFESESSDLTAQAARYSLLGGGKRIRPILMMLFGEVFSVSREDIIPFACALEMIHTYSLIHDDLPCMDNDTLRRGRPTCHVQFSEPTALLAGDALLNGAYEILLEQCVRQDRTHCLASLYIAKCAGIKGMIGGQSEDITSVFNSVSEESLYSLHHKKTGALIRASVLVPWILSGQSETSGETTTLLELYASCLGLSFQIKDDLLDVTATSTVLGKTAGKDQEAGKATFVTVFGRDKAEILFSEEVNKALIALRCLDESGFNTNIIIQWTKELSEREK